MTGRRRVVITGLGVATPIGIGIDRMWESLLQQRCGIRRIETFDASALPAQIGGELPPFSFGDFIPKTYRKSAKVMARDIIVAVICAYHAVRDAGLATKCLIDRGEVEGPPNLDPRRFGANIGAGLICADLNELARALSTAVDEQGRFSLAQWGTEGMNNLTPLWLLKFLPNMLACHVTIVHDARAPSNTLTCGEASSHLAIGEAFRTIARGDAEVCICGGAESKINPMAVLRPVLWNRLNTTDNETPARASRPFGADRAGMVVSEGGGLVILEALEHARDRRARIYAELVGFGSTANTTSWSKADPTGQPLNRAIRAALADAGRQVDQIDLVTPFGTGTDEADAAEIAAWNDALGRRLDDVPALSTRGAIGNNGAGSGSIDFAAAVMALHHNTVPVSLNTAALDPACRFRFVQDRPIDARIDTAISVSYALAGGQNAALVIRRYQE